MVWQPMKAGPMASEPMKAGPMASEPMESELRAPDPTESQRRAFRSPQQRSALERPARQASPKSRMETPRSRKRGTTPGTRKSRASGSGGSGSGRRGDVSTRGANLARSVESSRFSPAPPTRRIRRRIRSAPHDSPLRSAPAIPGIVVAGIGGGTSPRFCARIRRPEAPGRSHYLGELL